MKSSMSVRMARKRASYRCLPLVLLLSHNPTCAFYMHRASRTDFANAPALFEDEPVVVEDVISIPKCDQWLDHILTRSRKEVVQVHFDGHHTTELTLSQATRLCEQKSSHWDPLYATSIGSSCSTDQLPLYDTLEELFVNPDTEFDDTLDWFALLGRHVPIHDTLVVAGEGATSPTICSHPYTKLILCLEGSQLIRVLPPSKAQAKPIWTEAWDGFPIGWGSQLNRDLNLFAYRHREVDEDESYEEYRHYAEDPTKLHPNFALPKLEDETNPWHSDVLMPGNLAVIPPGWWYQTYVVQDAMNVCVHSQRCGGSEMGSQMVESMLESAMGNSRLQLVNPDKDYYYTQSEAQELVDKLLDLLQEHYEDNDNDNNDPKKKQKKSQSER